MPEERYRDVRARHKPPDGPPCDNCGAKRTKRFKLADGRVLCENRIHCRNRRTHRTEN